MLSGVLEEETETGEAPQVDQKLFYSPVLKDPTFLVRQRSEKEKKEQKAREREEQEAKERARKEEEM